MNIHSSKVAKTLATGVLTLISSAVLVTTSMADTRDDIEYRIKKVGRLNIVEAAAPASAATANDSASAVAADAGTASAGASAGGDVDGEALFTAKCAACHATGVLGAPILGNADNWAPRIAQGKETLYSHAMNGFNSMPARGGAADLSDDQVKAIVDFMVSKAQ